VTGGAIRMPPLASDDTSPSRRRNGWRHPAAAPGSEVAVLDEVAARGHAARGWGRLALAGRDPGRAASSRLDINGDLAAGESPDATVALSLRARMLVRMQTRRDLARSAQRVLAAAAHAPEAGHLPVPVCRDRIQDCSAELRDLIRRLLAVGPVSAQGVAQARALLADATSPVYHRASADKLRARVRAAVDALSPC
jgi:hypothetical protein